MPDSIDKILDDYHSTGTFVVETTMHSFSRLKQISDAISEQIQKKEFSQFNSSIMDAYVYRNDVIVRVLTVFDANPTTFSLPTLEIYLRKNNSNLAPYFSSNLALLRKNHKQLLLRLKKNRDGAIAHLGREPLDKILIEAQELLNLPIESLLKDISNLLTGLYMERALKSLNTKK